MVDQHSVVFQFSVSNILRKALPRTIAAIPLQMYLFTFFLAVFRNLRLRTFFNGGVTENTLSNTQQPLSKLPFHSSVKALFES